MSILEFFFISTYLLCFSTRVQEKKMMRYAVCTFKIQFSVSSLKSNGVFSISRQTIHHLTIQEFQHFVGDNLRELQFNFDEKNNAAQTDAVHQQPYCKQYACALLTLGVTTILALRFTSNHGRQDIIPKNFSWFGDFPWEVGVHIFYVCSFRKFKA